MPGKRKAVKIEIRKIKKTPRKSPRVKSGLSINIKSVFFRILIMLLSNRDWMGKKYRKARSQSTKIQNRKPEAKRPIKDFILLYTGKAYERRKKITMFMRTKIRLEARDDLNDFKKSLKSGLRKSARTATIPLTAPE